MIFDVGCEWQGYVSDTGRTFPVSGRFTDDQRAILTMEVGVADAIITADGRENLTSHVARTPAGLEALMRVNGR